MSEPTKPQEGKVFRLIEYLKRLASLRYTLVRDIDTYEKVLWVSDIPRENGCFAQAWGRDEDCDPAIWAEVQNRREPELPSVPDQCQDWINKSFLRNKSNVPELLPEITRQIKNPTWREGSDEPEFTSRTERIEDHPEVQRRWDRYLEERWVPWTEEHNVWDSIHRAYSKLFVIHQEQLRLGEEYELVLGLGLLTWQTPTEHRVCRHLIAANASLEFEAQRQTFRVRPHPDGTRLRPELDMLDVADVPLRAEETAKAGLTVPMSNGDGNQNPEQESLEDPWEKSIIQGVLEALTHSFFSRNQNGEQAHGEYHDRLEKEGVRATSKPIVEYAPAIILRKRSARGLTETLKQIKERIEDGGEIPGWFGDLAELQPRGDARSDEEPESTNGEFEGELFFPKPSNEKQRSIVDKLQTASGVLVQGPPGTGKSHTIANLICHLLATGQRILVTAKTPRALQVLAGLVPPELRPLCINLLGSGPEEKQSLEASVDGILNKNEGWDEDQATREREELDQRLRNLREEKARTDRRLRDIRESETHSQSIAEGTYRGTAARIAEAVNRDRSIYEWFTDTVPLDKACPVSGSNLQIVLEALRLFTPKKRHELGLVRPDALPSVEEIASLVASEEEAIKESARSAQGADEQTADHLAGINANAIEAIRDSLTDFQGERRRLSASPYSWMRDALCDVLSSNPSLWRELHRVTRDTIDSIGTLVSVADEASIDFPDEPNPRTLLEDVCKLKEHLENGGKLGWGPFRPKLVKERLYILQTVRVGGRSCANLDRLSVVTNALQVRVECAKAWGFWKGRCDAIKGPYALQLHTLRSLCDALDSAISLEGLIAQCRDTSRQCPALGEPVWANESEIEQLIASCSLALARHKKRLMAEGIRNTEAPLAALAAKSAAHPVANELLKAIRDRDVDAYAHATSKVQDLKKGRQRLRQVDEYIEKLRRAVPELTEALERTCDDTCWEERIGEIRNAWHWAQARSWIEEYIRQEDAPSLSKRAKQIVDEINTIIAELASLHAWSFCCARLTDDHCRHMTAWNKHVNSLTKTGRGKRDFRNRRAAQRSLNECKDAVPAWVMPLHRVWDTVDPYPGMFDVIIVDEASQCGFEALPLFYLGKKILIVGDPKQISPSGEFQDVAAINKLMQEFLYDFEFPEYFDVNVSLFDQGALRFGKRTIRLLEHFRCMPEIIRFSNDLCYSDQPLIPLRQFGSERLTPLEHVFVEGGYREGTRTRMVNHPEAESLVETVVECVTDERYEGKTMGVIVLQGEAQARLIEKMLLERIGAPEIEDRRLICGSPYSFQGDERDIMFLSMVVAPDEHGIFREGPTGEKRYNVAASRAKDQMWLFHSVRVNDLSNAYLRKRLLQFFENTQPQKVGELEREELERRAVQDNRMIIKPPPPFDSWFEVDVALALARKGFNVLPQYEVAGKRIDLVVQDGPRQLAVECNGDVWHGVDRYEADMQRQRQLERCKWVFFTVTECAFYSNKDRALKGLWRALEERGIVPHDARDHVELNDNGNEFNEAATTSSATVSQGISEDAEAGDSPQHEAASDDDDDPVEGESSTSQPWSLRGEAAPQPKLLGPDTERRQSPDLRGESQGETPIRENGHPAEPEAGVVSGDKTECASFADPRTGTLWEIEAGLKQIVSEYGPLPCHYAYRLYIRQAGFRKVSRRVEEVLGRCMESAAARGEIELSDEYGNDELRDKIAHLAGSALVRMRPRGARKIEDIPPSELAEAMRILETKGDCGRDEEEVFRKTLDFFDLKRLTKRTQEILMVALAIYTDTGSV
ncbi:hypothetical protein LCGC14_0315750 [marine sediment metagenome]|uniref:AAA+ ATPase domain-containing protein n=1 Tax=marine sediment metagenome TaxID=412755 RepID=A0A0F9TR63_9ZZZZ|nr:AAA family ATPase [Phycisphaerae bacterium]HDZ44139.1 AAA family ATPase [Phycisphaerae bacterium]